MVEPAPTAPRYQGELEIDIHGRAGLDLRTTFRGDFDIEIRPTAQSGFDDEGLMGADALVGTGLVEHFPEAGTTMFATTFPVRDTTSPRCPDGRVALAVSLVRRDTVDEIGGAPRIAGSIAAYCGERHYGKPLRLFRVSGNVPQSE